MAQERTQERADNRRITFQIEAHLGVLSRGKDGWNKELNLVSWNGSAIPKFDIRDWSQDHRKMGRGITLFGNEMGKACHMYLDYCNAKIVAESRDNRSAAAEAGIRAGEEERAKLEQERAEREHLEIEQEQELEAGQTYAGAVKEQTEAETDQKQADAEVAQEQAAAEAALEATDVEAGTDTGHEEEPF